MVAPDGACASAALRMNTSIGVTPRNTRKRETHEKDLFRGFRAFVFSWLLLSLSRARRRRSRELQRAVVAEHHLFPCLLAPSHGRRRIGVVAIARRIVVVHRDLQRRPLRQELG